MAVIDKNTFLTFSGIALSTLLHMLIFFRPSQSVNEISLDEKISRHFSVKIQAAEKKRLSPKVLPEKIATGVRPLKRERVKKLNLANNGASKKRFQETSNRPPNYPEVARRMEWEGSVELSLELNVDGQVIGVKLIQSSGHALLDREAIAAAKQWRFKYADSSSIKKTISFKLE